MMETPKNQENETFFSTQKLIKILIFVVILAIPLVYLSYKKVKNPIPPPPNEEVNKPSPINISDLEQQAKTNPSYNSYLNLAVAYLNNKVAGRAIEPLNKALEIKPNDPIIFNNLGYAYALLKDYDEGIKYCEKAIQIDSSFQLAKNNLNWAKSEKEKLFKAISKMEETPEKDRTAVFYIDLGINYQSAKQYEKSIECWNKTLAFDPKSSTAYNNIGVSYIFMKKFDDAINALNKAIEIKPDFQLAKNNIAWANDEKSKDVGGQK